MIIASEFNELVKSILQIAAVLAVAAVPIAGTFGSGIYVLRPLDRAARKRRLPTQFTIVDFLALVTHLSIPLGLMGPASKYYEGTRGPALVLIVFGCLAAFLIWCGTVATAAKAGITQPLKRLLMIGLVVPVTFVAAFAFGPTLLYLVCTPFTDGKPPSLWLGLLAVVTGGVLLACRRTVDWILAPTREVAPPEPIWPTNQSGQPLVANEQSETII